MEEKTLEYYKKELEKSQLLWSKHSCDCLHFEITWIENKIKELSKKD